MTESGKYPVRDFLDDLRSHRPELFKALVAGIHKLRDRNNHRWPLRRSLNPYPFWELKCSQGRIFFWYPRNDLVVFLDGVVKKEDKLPPRILKNVDRQLSDYQERCMDDDEEDTIDEQFYGY